MITRLSKMILMNKHSPPAGLTDCKQMSVSFVFVHNKSLDETVIIVVEG